MALQKAHCKVYSMVDLTAVKKAEKMVHRSVVHLDDQKACYLVVY